MNYQQVLVLIQQYIVANSNNEITANVLRPILEAILDQPNELIGDLDGLQTDDRSNLVAAINEVLDGNGGGSFDPDFTTQIIDSGGNYNNLEVTADLLVFTNENAQAILNGIWGRKEFHILNLSSQYEIMINHDSSSVSGNGQPIMLPTNSGTAGIKGTARVLQTDSYGYFVADTWGSKYRPEFSEVTEDKVMLVGADHRAKAEDIIQLKFYKTNQATAMDSTELENEYPNSIQGTEVICTPINKKYEKIDNLGNWVEIDFVTV